MSLASKHENTHVLLTELGVWVFDNLKIASILVTTQFEIYLSLGMVLWCQVSIPSLQIKCNSAYLVEQMKFVLHVILL